MFEHYNMYDEIVNCDFCNKSVIVRLHGFEIIKSSYWRCMQVHCCSVICLKIWLVYESIDEEFQDLLVGSIKTNENI